MKPYLIRFPFCIFFLTAGLCFFASNALAFRCGENVISAGDTKSRVIMECGKPTYKEKVGSKDVYTSDQGNRNHSKSSKKVEQWSYNCGEGDFIYVLEFEGGKLVREDTNGRGHGKSHCLGK
ncbi:MAG: hypothetical protein CSYNP_01792 [Syntrophus sp. SKADARSKE-3]|nr:hypothetical protein [Syntrophus sp. SKADARSKE-3]